MKKIILVALCLFMLTSAYAMGGCSDKNFSIIKEKVRQMEKAWGSANLEKVVSFYAKDFVYMSDGKQYTSKEKVLKHYVDGFAVDDSGKRDLGELKLDYQYCRDLDKSHQLVILEFTWTSPSGKVVSGHDLLVWQKDKNDKYKIIVDFPQS